MRNELKIRYLDIMQPPSDYFLKTGVIILPVIVMTLDEIQKIWPDASILPENKKDQ